jgi:hypothetical protein
MTWRRASVLAACGNGAGSGIFWFFAYRHANRIMNPIGTFNQVWWMWAVRPSSWLALMAIVAAIGCWIVLRLGGDQLWATTTTALISGFGLWGAGVVLWNALFNFLARRSSSTFAAWWGLALAVSCIGAAALARWLVLIVRRLLNQPALATVPQGRDVIVH